MKKRYKIMILSIITLILGFGVYNVFGAVVYSLDTSISSDTIDSVGTDVTLSLTLNNFESYQISSGEINISYNDDVFYIPTELDGDTKYIGNDGIFYNSFGNNTISTIVEEDKITISYKSDDESIYLKDDGTITLYFKVIDINDSVENFNVSMNNLTSYRYETGELTDVEIENPTVSVTVGDKKNISIKDILPNSVDKIYANTANDLLLGLSTYNISESTNVDFIIGKSYIYGDINFDGVVDSNDYDLFNSYVNGEVKLSELQLSLLDIFLEDANVENTNENILTYLDAYVKISDSPVGTYPTKTYLYGDLDLNGVVDYEDHSIIEDEVNIETFIDEEKLLYDLNSNDIIDDDERILLINYLGFVAENDPILNIGQYYNNDINIMIGDINRDTVIDAKDIDLITLILEDTSKFTQNDLIRADIDLNEVINVTDLGYLRTYINNYLDVNFELTVKLSEYVYGDVNRNGTIDNEDYNLLYFETSKAELDTEQQLLSNISDSSISPEWIIVYYLYIEENSKLGKLYDFGDNKFGDLNLDGNIDSSDLSIAKDSIDNKELCNNKKGQTKYNCSYYNLDVPFYSVLNYYENSVNTDDITLRAGLNTSLNNLITSLNNLTKGDVNTDGVIDFNDYFKIVEIYNTEDYLIEDYGYFSPEEVSAADINGNGDVDPEDIDIVYYYLKEYDGKDITGLVDSYFEGIRLLGSLIPSVSEVEKYIYGDLNLDGKIDESDLALANTDYDNLSEEAKKNIHLYDNKINMFGLLNYYLNDFTDEELESYLSSAYNLIGTENEYGIYGDINNNGDVNNADLMLILQYIVGTIELSSEQIFLGDLNKNGYLDYEDAILISQSDVDLGVESIKLGYIENVKPIGTTSLFNIENNVVGTNSNGYANMLVDFDTRNNIDVGIYSVIANSSINNIDNSSTPYTFMVEPAIVTSLALDKEEYMLYIGETVTPSVTINPSGAYIKDVVWNVKDENIASVDENGVVTAISEGETYIYANSVDGSKIQAGAKIIVQTQSVELTNVNYIPDYWYQDVDKLNNLDGGNITIDVITTNVKSDEISYVLTKSDSQTNIVDKVVIYAYETQDDFNKDNYIESEESVDITKIKINVSKNALESCTYTLTLTNKNSIVLGSIDFEILEYIYPEDIQIKYNDNEIENIKVIKSSIIELEGILVPENTFDKNVIFEYDEGVSIYDDATLFPEDIVYNSHKFGFDEVGTFNITAVSNVDGNIRKTVQVEVVSPSTIDINSTINSNIGNSSIDEKFGGIFTNVLKFNDVLDGTKLDVKLYDSNNNVVNAENYSIDENIVVEDGSATIEISFGGYGLVAGTYKVEYSYIMDDINKTNVTDYYNIEVDSFVPIQVINASTEEINLTIGETYSDLIITMLPSTSTHKDYRIVSNNNDVVTINSNNELVAQGVGETTILIETFDDSNISKEIKVNVSEESSISLSNVTYVPNKPYTENYKEVNNLDGGNITIDVSTTNVKSDEINYVLTKSDDNSQTNIVDKVVIYAYETQDDFTNDNYIESGESVDITKIKINVFENSLESGTYTLTLTNKSGIILGSINFEITEYISPTSINIKSNDKVIDYIKIVKGSSITLNAVISPTGVTNPKIKWSYEDGLSEYLNTELMYKDNITLTAKKEGIYKVEAISDANNDIKKTIQIEVISPTTSGSVTTINSNIGNDTIDEKFGGTFTNVINLTDVLDGTKLNVKLYDSNNNVVDSNKYLINENIVVTNGSVTIDITFGENAVEAGTYKVEYTYLSNDTYNTEIKEDYTITIQEFIPVSTISIQDGRITLTKGRILSDLGITMLPSTSTYKRYSLSTNNSFVTINENNELVANDVGISLITIRTLDDSSLSKTIVVEVVNEEIQWDLKSDKYLISNDNISNISDKLSYKTLLNNLKVNDGVSIKIFNGDKEIDYTNDIISTGMVLKTYVDNEVFNTYTLVISGDINGDGKVLANDMLLARMHILEKNILTGIKFEAGDINGDNRVNAMDILYMRRYILEITNNVWGN